jgi:hypothetical protein
VKEEEVPSTSREEMDVLHFRSKMEQVRDKFWRLKENDDEHALERMLMVLSTLVEDEDPLAEE